MPIYLFLVMEAPKAILKEIRNIQRKFLWEGNVDKKKWELVSWDKIYKPKSQGGLGIRYPKKNNEVLGEKNWWGWVTHNMESWAKLWHVKYA